jgi:hypothetical protein
MTLQPGHTFLRYSLFFALPRPLNLIVLLTDAVYPAPLYL